MMTKKVRWGIMGSSFISEVMAKAIDESVEGELIAIGSRSPSKLSSFAARFLVPKSYVNYQDMLNDGDIDAIYIGLPNYLHKEWTIRSAHAKKHILCEKPFVLTVSEAQEAFLAVAQNNVYCLEALMYRYHPLIKQLTKLVADKVIGDIKLFNASYSAPIAHLANPKAGGALRNLGCYPISLIRLLAGAEPIEIKAMGRFNPQTGNDNQTTILLKFANNVLATVSTTDDVGKFWHFEMIGEKGRIQVLSNPWQANIDDNIIVVTLNDKQIPQQIAVNATHSLYCYQINEMNNKILNGFSSAESSDSNQHSLGNIVVLESCWQQLASSC